MHLSLLISIASLAVATASYLRASRFERDQRRLRMRFRQLRSQLEALTKAGDANKAEEQIAFAEPSPPNGDQAENQPRRSS
jgi:hypothetical protein